MPDFSAIWKSRGIPEADAGFVDPADRPITYRYCHRHGDWFPETEDHGDVPCFERPLLARLDRIIELLERQASTQNEHTSR